MSDSGSNASVDGVADSAVNVLDGDDDGLDAFAADIADQVHSFVIAVREIAVGEQPASALSLLLLETSQLVLAGGRLGAVADVVPEDRFEPDAGPDPDIDELRDRLSVLLEPVNEFVEVHDPIDASRGAATFYLSEEIAGICAELLHGLQHYRDGRPREALWWWQFSYLSSWGSSLGAVVRVLHSLIAHTRLDEALVATA